MIPLKELQEAGALHMDHYGGKRLPYACIYANGLQQQLVKLEDPDRGRVFDVIDASGGYASACLGAGHSVTRTAMSALLTHCGYSTDEVGNLERALLLKVLFGKSGLWADRFPSSDYWVSGRNSGSEGVELALRLVLESNWDPRHLAPRSGREKRRSLIAFEGAWHGWTPGVQALLNRRHYRVGLPDTLSDPTRGLKVHFLPFGEQEPLEAFFAANGDTVAAAFVEPIQGDAGILVPPPGYLRRLAELCRRHQVLLVADEVLTFAKTGQFFAMEDDGPVPTDITVIGKSLGFGVMPVAFVIARRDLAIRSSGAVATSDLRPLQCGLARLGIEHIRTEGLLERSRMLGESLCEQLREVTAEFSDIFGEVRGKGFLIGMELTEPAAGDLLRLRRLLIESGVYVEFMAGAGRRSGHRRYLFPALRLTPPLVCTDPDLRRIVDAVRAAASAFRSQRT